MINYLLLRSNCRFNPTCSQYAIEVVCRFGLKKGCWLIVKRVLKCYPLHKGDDYLVQPRTKDHNRENRK